MYFDRNRREFRILEFRPQQDYAASLRRASQSLKNLMTEFQLRVLGVTATGKPGFRRASSEPPVLHRLELRDVACELLAAPIRSCNKRDRHNRGRGLAIACHQVGQRG